MQTPTDERTDEDHNMPADWHAYADNSPVILSDALEHLAGEADDHG